MRHLNYSSPLFLSLLLLASTALHAQAPAAGTTVSVKMIDTVNSGSDPAGKQYRASVTKAVTAANGIAIAQGAAATVTLTSSGPNYAAQLSSVTINGQAVAVTSNSASATSAAQSAAGSAAASAVGSVLGGFGHHVSAPASVAIAATGQDISLPTGTTLTFVLGTSPASAAPAAQPMTASAEPAPAPASSPAATSSASASGGVTTLVVCYSNINSLYLSAAFDAPADRYGDATLAFSNYLQATYHYSFGVKCLPIFTIDGARDAQKPLAGFAVQLKPIETGWRLGQPPVTQGQSGFDPLAQGPGGIDLTQHRLTTYFCSFTAPGGTTMAVDLNQPNRQANETTYVSQVFQADWDSAPVSMAYKVYIRDHYVHDLNPTANLSPNCSAQSPAMQTMQHQSAMLGTKLIRHIVPVDFTDTSAEASGGNAAMAQVASATQAAAAQTAAATFFVSCSSGGGAGIDTYYTGVFEIGAKPGRSPHPPNTPGAYVGETWMVPAVLSQTVLDHFYAYLTQKGYKFSPGSSSACDIKPTAAETQAAQHKRAYEGGGCSTCGKIVETGWKE